MGEYSITVYLRGCGELILANVREVACDDPEKVRFVVEAYRPGA